MMRRGRFGVRTRRVLENRGLRSAGGTDGDVCDETVTGERRARFVVFLHADLRSDGLILLLDRELRRNVRWRGSDTGSWGCQDCRPQIILFSSVASGAALQTEAFGGGKGLK